MRIPHVNISAALVCGITFATVVPAPPAGGQVIIRERNDGGYDNNRRNERERDARAARAEVERAETRVRAAAARVRTSWKANPEMVAAEKELDTAREERDKERKRIVQALEKDSAYQKIKSEHAGAAGEVRTETDKVNATQPAGTQPSAADVTPGQIEAATEKLESKSELRNFEDRAVAADAAANSATARFDASQEQLKAMQLQLDAALINDPEYKSAQDELAAARTRLTTPSNR